MVLITGAGLIGAHLARELLVRGQPVVLYDLSPSEAYLATILEDYQAPIVVGDVADAGRLAAIAQEHKVNCIVHTAALIGAAVHHNPTRGVEVNLHGTLAVAEAARAAGVPRVVFCSSVAIYALDRLPARAAITELDPVGPKNLYGATKLASEQLLIHLAALYGFEVFNLRLAGVYGRGQYAGGSWMGRKLNRLLEAGIAGRNEIFKPEWIGTQEYVYVKDAACALAEACLTRSAPPGAYNIGTGELHSAEQVLAEIQSALPELRVRVDPAGPVVSYLQRTQAFDLSKARQHLNYRPLYSFQAGLQDYIGGLQRFRGTYQRFD